MWGGTRDFFSGAAEYAWNGVQGCGYGLCKAGEWMYADFQYEHFNDRSFFQDKSYRATDGWKSLGRAAKEDLLILPGILEEWRNSTSPAAWGKAAVDIGLWGLSAAKMYRSFANMGKAGRVGEEFVLTRKLEKTASTFEKFVAETGLIKESTFSLTPGNFFASKTYSGIQGVLTKKFGNARPGAPGGMSFFNSKTGRTFHLHHQEGHMNGKPHVDIRRRGPYEERKYLLKDEVY